MSKLDGISTTRPLEKNPQTRVVVMSKYDGDTAVTRVIRNGARVFVAKDSALIKVIRAIEKAYEGGYYFSPKISGAVAESLLDGGQRRLPDDPEATLTERKQEILRLICEDDTERNMAKKLTISHHTVHVHKSNIMNQLNLHSKVELVKYAVKKRTIHL